MSFISVDFFLLLPLAAVIFHLTPLAWRRHCLLAYSYLFYCTWSVLYAGLLLAASLIVYFLGLRIDAAGSESTKKRYLILGICGLTSILALFKYGPALASPLASLAVPLGISYYTFKLLSYLLEVYWEKIKPERDIVAFALYPAFFPHILSGPIERGSTFLPQVDTPTAVSPDMIASGLRLILFGLFKKLVVADRLAFLVNRVFDHPKAFSSVGLIIASYGFAVQIYADFSGLTDLAIGTGRIFGIESPQNFDAPFYAPNIQEFWKRWHMTLTRWLTDYLFTPLRFALRKHGDFGLAFAIVVNMLAIGLWHGPRWTYVLFGLLNSVYLVVSAFTLKARNRAFRGHTRWMGVRRIAGPLVTFHLVVLALLVFRANTVGNAAYILMH